MTEQPSDAVEPVTDSATGPPTGPPSGPPSKQPSNPDASPAPRWADAVARNAQALARPLEIARAGGVDDHELAVALRFAGAGFEPFLDRQRAVANSVALTDEWALGWASTVIRLVTARRFADGSLAQWVVRWVAPLVPADRGCTPAAIGDLVEAAARLDGQVDVTGWARGVESAVGAWPEGEPLSDLRLREVGAVAAWRAGFVRLRGAARAAALTLPPEVAAAVLGTPGGPATVRSALAANASRPGEWPGVAGSRRSIGAFRGFGGPWRLPPVVLGGDGHRWSVRSGSERFTVLTDAFGTAVLAAPEGSGTLDPYGTQSAGPPQSGSPPQPIELPPGWAGHGGDVTGAARAAGLALVSHAHSHRLSLVPDDGGAPTPELQAP
ncbi:hypothetical protein BA895_17280 [Humibacillus sp. DSM 29435]|uniref:hypothetical protein n=1 Tax=Humibacillus sp. DSM 29435 TaxID=1869167 RepID=UPI000892C8F2|nr:hypothetical protein [Humibacillus sp. DSM 29435]OFE17207.1 hypothetical protein BA895_17280 [Humibacillus sp. DSM 29435]